MRPKEKNKEAGNKRAVNIWGSSSVMLYILLG